MNQRIRELQAEIYRIEEQLESEKLLQRIWIELDSNGQISNELRYALQNHFGVDDSE